MGYQEMLNGELFPFAIEIEDKKIIFNDTMLSFIESPLQKSTFKVSKWTCQGF